MKIDRVQAGNTQSVPPQSSAVPVTSSTPFDSVQLGSTGGTASTSPAQIRRLFEPGITPSAQVIWKAPIDDWRENPDGGGFLPDDPVLSRDGSCYVGTHRGEVIAYKPDGQVRWSFDLGEHSAYNEPVPAWDGSLLFTNEKDRRLLCLNPDGTPRFDMSLPEPAITRPSMEMDGRVIVGGSKRLHAVGSDGKMLWSSKLPARYCGFMTRPDRSVLVYGTGEKMNDPVVLQCVSPKGKETWRYTLEGRPGGLPANGPAGETVMSDGNLVRVLDSKGSVAAVLDLGSPAGEPMVDPQGHIYIGTADGRLVALDLNGLPPSSAPGQPPASLPTLWSSKLSGGVKGHLVLGPEGEIYCRDGRFLTCVSGDGSTRWSASLGRYDNISTTVDPDGTAFVVLDCRRLQIFDNKGPPRGTMEAERLAISSSAPLPGKIAACDYDSVYVISPGSLKDVFKDLPEGTGRPPGTVERIGDWFIVDGVRLPVRKQPF